MRLFERKAFEIPLHPLVGDVNRSLDHDVCNGVPAGETREFDKRRSLLARQIRFIDAHDVGRGIECLDESGMEDPVDRALKSRVE